MKHNHDLLLQRKQKKTKRAAFAAFCAAVALSLLLLILVGLSFVALTETTDMNMNNSMLENVEYRTDSLPKNLLSLVLLLLLSLLWCLCTDRCRGRTVGGITLLAITAFGIWFVLSSQSAPTHDSLIVSRAAYAASQNDPSGLAGDYFRRFPFQLGYVLWSEGLIRLFHLEGNYLVIEVVNVLCLAVTYCALLSSVALLYGRGRVYRLTCLLMLLFLPPILFCSFAYGNLPGLMLAALALQQVLCLSAGKRQWLHVLLAALLIGAGVAVKKNCMILLVAMGILLAVRMIKKFRLSSLVCLLLSVGFAVAIPAGVQAHYEKRFGLDFGEGIPMLSWAAMGLSDSYIAPGWYNGTYTVTDFHNAGMDPDKAAKRSAEVIRERLEDFRQAPAAARAFFSEKLRSQWNEPTCQSIWTNQVRGQYGEKGMLAAWICGEGEGRIKAWMNAVQQFLLVMAAVGTVWLIKRARRIEDALLPTGFIGGFLYHMIFEAKSQYLIPYYILLLPIAACGIHALLARIKLPHKPIAAGVAARRRTKAAPKHPYRRF